MVNTISKSLQIGLELLLDASLFCLLFTVNSVEDINGIVKLFTSVVIGLFTIIRVIYYLKDRVKEKKDKEDTVG